MMDLPEVTSVTVEIRRKDNTYTIWDVSPSDANELRASIGDHNRDMGTVRLITDVDFLRRNGFSIKGVV